LRRQSRRSNGGYSSDTLIEAMSRRARHSPSRCVRQILVAYSTGSRRRRRGPQP
jgi:hypothetical protein